MPEKIRRNVVFTGFRNPELEDIFGKIGYVVADNVDSNSIVLISASTDHQTNKCKAAINKGVPIVDFVDVQKFIAEFTDNI